MGRRVKVFFYGSDQQTVYGTLGSATHAELEHLYLHARTVLGGTYLPEAIVAYTSDLAMVPALCYIADTMAPGPTDGALRGSHRIAGAGARLSHLVSSPARIVPRVIGSNGRAGRPLACRNNIHPPAGRWPTEPLRGQTGRTFAA
jgi:hypothetical protein